MIDTKITAYKGFSKDMKCRDYQYEIGETYKHEGIVSPCNSGFHACENPLDVFSYYPPAESVFAIVEQSGEIKSESDKICSAVITIKAEISLHMMIDSAVKVIFAGLKKQKTKGATKRAGKSLASNTGDQSAASNTGDQSAASVEGENSVAIVTGYQSKAKASKGSWIVVTERNDDYEIICVKTAKAGTSRIKADTYYTLEKSKFVEVKS